MTHIEYIKGDATQPTGIGTKLIIHVCNNIGVWGKGFVVSLARVFPRAKSEYIQMMEQNNHIALGIVQFVEHLDRDIVVANMLAQNGVCTLRNHSPIDYMTLSTTLAKIAHYVTNQSSPVTVHMPRIGGGRWEHVEALIQQQLCQQDISVTVYSL